MQNCASQGAAVDIAQPVFSLAGAMPTSLTPVAENLKSQELGRCLTEADLPPTEPQEQLAEPEEDNSTQAEGTGKHASEPAKGALPAGIMHSVDMFCFLGGASSHTCPNLRQHMPA